MEQKTFPVRNKRGFPTRGLAKFVRTVKASKSEVWVEKDGERRDGKNILDLLTLTMPYGSTVTVTVEGEDEDTVMQQISVLMESGLCVGEH